MFSGNKCIESPPFIISQWVCTDQLTLLWLKNQHRGILEKMVTPCSAQDLFLILCSGFTASSAWVIECSVLCVKLKSSEL